MKIGFIGLGMMGSRMAARLLHFDLMVATHTASKAAAWPGKHGSYEEVARHSQIILLCVSNDDAVRSVASAILPHIAPGTIVVDTSTVSPAVAEEMASRGVLWLDAPVSGGIIGAEKGTLTIMVGGDQGALDCAWPVLEALSSRITHFGPTGSGLKVKMCNQVMAAINTAGVCEALTLASKHGLDLEKVHRALLTGTGGGWVFEHFAPQMIRGDYAPGFMVKWQLKDLGIALGEKLPLPTASAAYQLLLAAQAQGHGDCGTSVLFPMLQKMSGMNEK